jgi:acyl-CoA ligase (AMP-forming) (exosortase A-associated)
MISLVHHLLRDSARKWPDKEALVHGAERLSYAAVDARSSMLANALIGAGLDRSQRVGIYLEKSVHEALSIFAVSKAGGVFVPINHQLFPEQVGHILGDCEVQGLITSAAKLETILDVVQKTPSLKFVLLTDGPAPDLGSVAADGFERIFREESERAPADRAISHDMAALLYTSGSTGRPKGVVLTHANLIAGSRIVSTYLEIGPEDRIVSILPFSFDYGLNQMLTAFQHGGAIVLLNFRFPDEIVQTLLKEKITGFAGVPPLWTLVTQARSSVFKHPFPALRYITNSGGAVTSALLANLKKAFPSASIFLMYGLTEAFRSTFLPPSELDRRPGSMGKAIPDTEIFVVNEKDELCKPGEVGELVHRGPTVSLGYWKRPEDTARVIRPHPLQPKEIQVRELVCYSGDLVTMDADGFLYFVGRRDSTIKSSGHRISPTEVEEAIASFGRIRDIAAIGVPDEALGQAIKVFIVPQPGERITEDELRAHCALKMPRYMIPRDFEFLDEIAKTSSGKVDYKTLKSRELERPKGSAGAAASP